MRFPSSTYIFVAWFSIKRKSTSGFLLLLANSVRINIVSASPLSITMVQFFFGTFLPKSVQKRKTFPLGPRAEQGGGAEASDKCWKLLRAAGEAKILWLRQEISFAGSPWGDPWLWDGAGSESPFQGSARWLQVLPLLDFPWAEGSNKQSFDHSSNWDQSQMWSLGSCSLEKWARGLNSKVLNPGTVTRSPNGFNSDINVFSICWLLWSCGGRQWMCVRPANMEQWASEGCQISFWVLELFNKYRKTQERQIKMHLTVPLFIRVWVGLADSRLPKK